MAITLEHILALSLCQAFLPVCYAPPGGRMAPAVKTAPEVKTSQAVKTASPPPWYPPGLPQYFNDECDFGECKVSGNSLNSAVRVFLCHGEDFYSGLDEAAKKRLLALEIAPYLTNDVAQLQEMDSCTLVPLVNMIMYHSNGGLLPAVQKTEKEWRSSLQTMVADLYNLQSPDQYKLLRGVNSIVLVAMACNYKNQVSEADEVFDHDSQGRYKRQVRSQQRQLFTHQRTSSQSYGGCSTINVANAPDVSCNGVYNHVQWTASWAPNRPVFKHENTGRPWYVYWADNRRGWAIGRRRGHHVDANLWLSRLFTDSPVGAWSSGINVDCSEDGHQDLGHHHDHHSDHHHGLSLGHHGDGHNLVHHDDYHGYHHDQHYGGHPTYGHDQHAYGLDQPTYSHDQSTYGHDQPTYGHDQHTYGHDQHAYGHDQPTYGNEQHTYGRDQPTYGHDQSTYSHDQSTYGHDRHIYGHDPHTYGHDQQSYGHDQQPYGQDDRYTFTPDDQYTFTPDDQYTFSPDDQYTIDHDFDHDNQYNFYQGDHDDLHTFDHDDLYNFYNDDDDHLQHGHYTPPDGHPNTHQVGHQNVYSPPEDGYPEVYSPPSYDYNPSVDGHQAASNVGNQEANSYSQPSNVGNKESVFSPRSPPPNVGHQNFHSPLEDVGHPNVGHSDPNVGHPPANVRHSDPNVGHPPSNVGHSDPNVGHSNVGHPPPNVRHPDPKVDPSPPASNVGHQPVFTPPTPPRVDPTPPPPKVGNQPVYSPPTPPKVDPSPPNVVPATTNTKTFKTPTNLGSLPPTIAGKEYNFLDHISLKESKPFDISAHFALPPDLDLTAKAELPSFKPVADDEGYAAVP